MQERFVELVLSNPVNRDILDRGHELGVTDWWLTAGAVFQTVWNCLAGRDPQAAILDYDVFYFDAQDTGWEAEDAVIRRGRSLFGDHVEIRNEARVHLWYEARFGVPAPPFTSSRDAIDCFASTTCCFGLTRDADRTLRVYAPHGYDDLFAGRLRPNPVLAPRDVYVAKTSRWQSIWPTLTIDAWPDEGV